MEFRHIGMGGMMVYENVKDMSLLPSPGLTYRPTQRKKQVYKITEVAQGFAVNVVCFSSAHTKSIFVLNLFHMLQLFVI